VKRRRWFGKSFDFFDWKNQLCELFILLAWFWAVG